MTKKEAIAIWRAEILPAVRAQYEQDGRIDHPARAEAWNNWTDQLRTDGQITAHQYDTWVTP
jgi:hypothetical protein